MRKNWLYGKTVVISGASSGIGKHVTRLLVKKYGCCVIGIARNEERLLALKAELGESFTFERFDVAVRENWRNLAEKFEKEGTQVDLLINNAGIMPLFEKSTDASVEELERVMSVNFFAAVYALDALYPNIQRSKTPAVVNVASSAGLCPLPGISTYTASKSAIRAYTESMITEQKRKMYVGLICPGMTKTNLFDRHKNGEKSVIDIVSMDVEKMSKKIVRAIARRKKRSVFGFDAHLMSGIHRVAPVCGLSFCEWIMRKAKVRVFAKLFGQEHLHSADKE